MTKPTKQPPPLHTPSLENTPVVTLDLNSSSSSNNNHVLRELHDLGVDLLLPPSSHNNNSKLTNAMGDFCDYVLGDDTFETITLTILQQYMYSNDENNGEPPPVGELQGSSGCEDQNGSNPSSSIFRVVLPSPPLQQLLQHYHKAYPHCRNVLTEQSILDYMLQMCKDGRRTVHADNLQIVQLGNPMLIFSRGNFQAPPYGQQIPHIDHCQPNVQVGVFMSRNCPSTIIMEPSHSIDTVDDLIDYWESEHGNVPTIIKETLLQIQDEPLSGILEYLDDWHTINTQLGRFGNLCSNICKVYRVTNCPPGTTLLAHDNPIHAGPPFQQQSPRMFAYAIGIPDAEELFCGEKEIPKTHDDDDKNDGEVQYNQVLLHVDLCCILFTIWDGDSTTTDDNTYDQIHSAKRYMLNMLPNMIRAFPYETFQRLLSDDRASLRQWLYDLRQAVVVSSDANTIDGLLETIAVNASRMFTCPDMACRTKQPIHRDQDSKRASRKDRKRRERL